MAVARLPQDRLGHVRSCACVADIRVELRRSFVDDEDDPKEKSPSLLE